jgi:hypothetical protein
MSYIRPRQATLLVKDFVDQVIAMRLLTELEPETHEVPGPTPRSKRQTVEVRPVKAELAVFQAGRAVVRGTTKVYPQTLANTLRNANGGAWVIGFLRNQAHKSDSSRTVWVLDDAGISDADFDAFGGSLPD